MIAKYRNCSFLWFAGALIVSFIFGFAFSKGTFLANDDRTVVLIFTYLGAAALWMAGCFSLAKAKGYSDDTVGGIFLFLFILGCFVPLAPCIFPLGILCLKDKTSSRERHRRRRE